MSDSRGKTGVVVKHKVTAQSQKKFQTRVQNLEAITP